MISCVDLLFYQPDKEHYLALIYQRITSAIIANKSWALSAIFISIQAIASVHDNATSNANSFFLLLVRQVANFIFAHNILSKPWKLVRSMSDRERHHDIIQRKYLLGMKRAFTMNGLMIPRKAITRHEMKPLYPSMPEKINSLSAMIRYNDL